MDDLPDVRLAHYRLRLRLEQAARLPGYLGSTLRGGLGYVLKKRCFEPERKSCKGCPLHHTCPYGYLFSPAAPPGAELIRAGSEIPPGFLLEPPLDWRIDYQAGDAIEFGLTLVGRAIDYLPYFVIDYRALGERGLGRPEEGQARAHYTLEEVQAVDPRPGPAQAATIYTAAAEAVHDCNLSASWAELAARAAAWPTGRLTIDLITPARLNKGRAYHRQPAFHILIRVLLRRLSFLAYFHGGQRWDADFDGWNSRAETVRTVAAGTRWVERERYSTRQRQWIRLDGTVGSMTYEGDLAPFGPLLAVGEWLHVGNDCVFGNGQYRVRG